MENIIEHFEIRTAKEFCSPESSIFGSTTNARESNAGEPNIGEDKPRRDKPRRRTNLGEGKPRRGQTQEWDKRRRRTNTGEEQTQERTNPGVGQTQEWDKRRRTIMFSFKGRQARVPSACSYAEG